jgi:hypothetical protein
MKRKKEKSPILGKGTDNEPMSDEILSLLGDKILPLPGETNSEGIERRKKVIAADTGEIRSTRRIGEMKSVRTTFKLLEQASQEIDRLAKKNKVTRRDVFDSVIYEPMLHYFLELRAKEQPSGVNNRKSLSSSSFKFIRKTCVIRQGTLNALNRLAAEFGFTRDYFMNLSILWQKHADEKISLHKHEYYKEVLKRIPDLVKLWEMEEKFLLITGHPEGIYIPESEEAIEDTFSYIKDVLDDLRENIEKFLQDGVDFEFDGSLNYNNHYLTED